MAPVLAPALGAVLVAALTGACSTAPPASSSAASAAPPSASSTASTDTPPSASPTVSPSTSRPLRPPSAGLPRRVRPRRESTTPAAPSQLVGLVRIVVSIGDVGRGETSTGMVLTSDGVVVTNRHGVTGATALQATSMSTGRTYTARLVASDRTRDVALLRLEGAAGLATVTLAGRDVAVGDPVTVVGDAHGLRSVFTAATGTVLARDQTLVTPTTPTARGERLTGMLLSSSDVVSGDSGGPTYGAGGRVVAMTTAAVPISDDLDGVAIPVGTLRSVLRALGLRSAS